MLTYMVQHSVRIQDTPQLHAMWHFAPAHTRLDGLAAVGLGLTVWAYACLRDIMMHQLQRGVSRHGLQVLYAAADAPHNMTAKAPQPAAYRLLASDELGVLRGRV